MKFLCGVCGKVEVDAVWGEDHHYVYQGMGVSQYVCLECGKRPFWEVWEALEKGVSYIGDKTVEAVLDGLEAPKEGK